MNQRSLRDPVPAVREDEAEGEIASLFADIRTQLGTSSVNLVWRHLATFPGALPWCWGAIAPLYRGGGLASQARDFRRILQGPVFPELPPEVRQVLDLDADDIAQICATLRGYYVSCTMNILSLNALRLFIEGSAHASRSAAISQDFVDHLDQPPSVETWRESRTLPMWRLTSSTWRGD